MRFFGTKDIKQHVKAYLLANAEFFKGKIIVDLPAGSGFTSSLLLDLGARLEAYDLQPDFFKEKRVHCKFADMTQSLPISDRHADVVICQEGIEHIADPLFCLREFNRILKPGGRLFITTPNMSNLRSKLAFLLNESELPRMLPPNETDAVWYGDGNVSSSTGRRIYFGHLFLMGIQKLRILSLVTGFKITRIHHTRINKTSLLLALLGYPLIFVSNLLAYRNAQKLLGKEAKTYKGGLREVLRLNLDFRNLIDQHLFVEFTKMDVRDRVPKTARFRHVYNDASELIHT